MKQPIRPDVLRTLRERHHLSQAKLANRSEEIRQKVSVATIKRIETWTETETYMANQTVEERLAKVLCVDVEDLAKLPDKKDDVSFAEKYLGFDRHRMSVSMAQRNLFDFQMVEHLYGIPVQAQIILAPLCMALLAEGSLAWRKKRVREIEDAVDELTSLGGNLKGHRYGHLSFVTNVESSVDYPAGFERDSIEKRDVFGKDVSEEAYGYDPSVTNPFAEYLWEFAKDMTNVEIDEDNGLHDVTDRYSFFGGSGGDFPRYRIGGGLLDDLTAGDIAARYALTRGHVRIGEIPEELLGADNADKRVEWIISRIPDEERAKCEATRKRLTEQSAELDLDSSETNPVESEGSQDDA